MSSDALRIIESIQKAQTDQIDDQLADKEKEFNAKFALFQKRVKVQKKTGLNKTHQFKWREEARDLQTQRQEIESSLHELLHDMVPDSLSSQNKPDLFILNIHSEIKEREDADDANFHYKRSLRADVTRPRQVLKQLRQELKQKRPRKSTEAIQEQQKRTGAMLKTLISSTQRTHKEMLKVLQAQETELSSDSSGDVLTWVRKMISGSPPCIYNS